jgi:hypothetical protein
MRKLKPLEQRFKDFSKMSKPNGLNRTPYRPKRSPKMSSLMNSKKSTGAKGDKTLVSVRDNLKTKMSRLASSLTSRPQISFLKI